MRFTPCIALVLLAAGQASAEPCAVNVVVAPPGVRAVVDQWVRAEPKCALALEVRIVPTDGGLYIHARDSAGRVRERIAPDAQTAAVLITSWAADDSISPDLERDRVDVGQLEWHPAHDQVAVGGLEWRPAGSRDRVAVLEWRSPAGPTPTVARRSFLIGGIVHGANDDDQTFAVRGELDLRARGPYRLGVGLLASHSTYDVYRANDTGDLTTTDVAATIYGGRTGELGPIHVRGTIGAGLVGTYLRGVLYGQDQNHSAYAWPEAVGVYPTVEASVALRLFGAGPWQVEFGPFVRWLGQSFAADMPASGRLPARGTEEMFLAALRWER